MPRGDGTGPLGQGPMTGRGLGYCVLKESKEHPGLLEGIIGLQARPIGSLKSSSDTEKEVINMPFGDGTSPVGLGLMTGRSAGFCVGFPVPGYMNPVGGAGFYSPGAPAFGPYGAGLYGYGAGYTAPYAYAGWVNPWVRRGFGFGRGFGRGRGWGRGRGRLGYCW